MMKPELNSIKTRDSCLDHSHLKTIRLFLGAAVDEKTTEQKPKKRKIFATHSKFFSNISQTIKAR